MKLLENVRGAKTAPEVCATAMGLGKAIGKVPVLVGVCDGFVGNRMLASRLREHSFMLEEGALPQQVDKVLYDFGFPMGPFAVADLAGLDIGWRNRKWRLDHLSPGNAPTRCWTRFASWAALARRPAPGFINTMKSVIPRPIP